MARRYKALHHNLKEGKNVIFHREHTSKKNRTSGFNISVRRSKKLMIKELEDKESKRLADEALREFNSGEGVDI
jgi:hypothetical protein